MINLNRLSKSTKFVVAFSTLVLLGQGCAIQFGGGGGGRADGGIWKSADKGENWVQKSAVPTVAPGARSIANASVNSIVQDPSDPQALYLATNENGLLYTYDGGDSWMQVPKLSVGRVNAVAVDPNDKCTIFLARANQVLKSTDCSRSFAVVYIEARANVGVVNLKINSRKSSEVLAGTSAGDLLKSTDSGNTWTTIQVFPSAPHIIVYDGFSTNTMYVATKANGVWKSVDEGKTWRDISAGLAGFSGSQNTNFLIADDTATNVLYLVSSYGLLRTGDGGNTWEKVNLLTPPGSTAIYSFAVNPRNTREMYYGTATTFYKTADGGSRWSTKKLPTSRAASALLVDYSNPNVVYMGGTQLKK